MFSFDDGQQATTNKTALIIAKAKYNAQLAPWVKSSLVRLAYAQPEVDRIIDEAIEETGADLEYVTYRFKSHLQEYVADAVEVTKPKHEDLSYKDQGVSFPGEAQGEAGLEDIKKDDVSNNTEVEGAGLEEQLNDGTKVNLADTTTETYSSLKDEATWPTCFRCSVKLNPVYAKVSPVCKECTHKLAYGETGYPGEDTGLDSGGKSPHEHAPNTSQLFQCSVCRQGGQLVKGTHDEIAQHVEAEHQDVLDQAQDETVEAKIADVPPGTTTDAVVPPAGNTPADRFDDMVQDLADRAAAQQFSTATEQDINNIAQQYGLDPQQIQQSLFSTAMFGKYTGSNGQIGGQVQAPEGYTEVQLQQAGPGSQEAIVPTDSVVKKVADETGETPEFVYQQVKDKYGADLPDKYHASVSGELHYYLPTEMVGQQPPQAQPPQQQQQAPPMPPPGGMPQPGM